MGSDARVACCRATSCGPVLRVPDLWAELLALLRPTARSLGTLELLEAVDPGRCEADLQLALGEPHAIAADLVERTLV